MYLVLNVDDSVQSHNIQCGKNKRKELVIYHNFRNINQFLLFSFFFHLKNRKYIFIDFSSIFDDFINSLNCFCVKCHAFIIRFNFLEFE